MIEAYLLELPTQKVVL